MTVDALLTHSGVKTALAVCKSRVFSQTRFQFVIGALATNSSMTMEWRQPMTRRWCRTKPLLHATLVEGWQLLQTMRGRLTDASPRSDRGGRPSILRPEHCPPHTCAARRQ